MDVMSRYIDADDVANAIYHHFPSIRTMADARASSKKHQAPSIDIVRCGECKHCKKNRGTFRGEPIFFYRCAEHSRDVESDDYCSWGEREGE